MPISDDDPICCIVCGHDQPQELTYLEPPVDTILCQEHLKIWEDEILSPIVEEGRRCSIKVSFKRNGERHVALRRLANPLRSKWGW